MYVYSVHCIQSVTYHKIPFISSTSQSEEFSVLRNNKTLANKCSIVDMKRVSTLSILRITLPFLQHLFRTPKKKKTLKNIFLLRQMKEWKKFQEEAAKRDHRKLGRVCTASQYQFTLLFYYRYCSRCSFRLWKSCKGLQFLFLSLKMVLQVV